MNAQCHEIESMIAPFLDGDLSKQEQSRVKKHLRDCPACRLVLEKEREVAEQLMVLPELKCSEEVTRKIENATVCPEREDSFRRRFKFIGEPFHWRTVTVGVALAAIVILFVVYPIFDRREPGQIPYSQEEMLQSKDEAKWSLAYVAQMVNKMEKNVIEDVLLKDLPRTVRKSIKKSIPLF